MGRTRPVVEQTLNRGRGLCRKPFLEASLSAVRMCSCGRCCCAHRDVDRRVQESTEYGVPRSLGIDESSRRWFY